LPRANALRLDCAGRDVLGEAGGGRRAGGARRELFARSRESCSGRLLVKREAVGGDSCTKRRDHRTLMNRPYLGAAAQELFSYRMLACSAAFSRVSQPVVMPGTKALHPSPSRTALPAGSCASMATKVWVIFSSNAGSMSLCAVKQQ